MKGKTTGPSKPNHSLSKWKNKDKKERVSPIPPVPEDGQRPLAEELQESAGEKEDILTQLSGSQSRLLHIDDHTHTHLGDGKESARRGSEGRATDYGQMLKLGEISTTKKKGSGKKKKDSSSKDKK